VDRALSEGWLSAQTPRVRPGSESRGADVFWRIHLAAEEALRAAMLAELDELSRLGETADANARSDACVYRAFEAGMRFSRDRAGNSHPQDTDARACISGGIVTATQVMSRVLEVIPEVSQLGAAHYGVDRPQLEAVARGSYGLLARLASQGGSIFSVLLRTLSAGGAGVPCSGAWRLDARSLVVQRRASRVGLAMADGVEQAALGRVWEVASASANNGPDVGCPAVYSGAMRRLWNWHVDVAMTVYERTVQGATGLGDRKCHDE
jgi:hypothetical protein